MKIAFFIQHMLCGGVETSLLARLQEYLGQECQITVYLLRMRGELLQEIPSEVSVQPIPMPEEIRERIPVGGIKLCIRELLEEKKIGQAIYMGAQYGIRRPKYAELMVDFHKIPELPEYFDIAINYHMHSPFLVRYVAEKVQAYQKLAWIHNDFYTTGYDILQLKGYLEIYDQFYCVSEQLREEFTEIFPSYREKTQIKYNLLQLDQIYRQAEKQIEDMPKVAGTLLLLSVGRLEYQKGFDLAIEAAALVKKKGYLFQWYILGEGSEHKKLSHLIQKRKLQDTVHLYGVRKNPYPYYKACDFYVQTSRHEGWGLALQEARVFNKRAVVTDFAGAREQIIDGVNGYIVEKTPEAIAEKIEKMIEDMKV